ncbi:MAG: sulfotransferase [Chloroflexota bacterium]
MGFFNKLFGRKPRQPVTIVSGLPRSGTSMMMKMLEAGGLLPLTDHLRTADVDNPKGYYEFERVKKLEEGDVAWLPEAEGKVVKVISALLKHLPDGYEYRVIFMRRNMSEILASQKKMLQNRGEATDVVSDEEIAALFDKHLQHIRHWIETHPNVSVLYLHYSDVLADPLPQARRVNAFLGNTLNVEAMALTVDPNLYRNRQ